MCNNEKKPSNKKTTFSLTQVFDIHCQYLAHYSFLFGILILWLCKKKGSIVQILITEDFSKYLVYYA